jgi:calcineurin-like phosphoesterase family protein
MWRLKDYAKKFQRVYYILGNHDYPLAWREAAQYKNVSVMGVENRWGLWISHVPIPEYELYRGNSICGHLHDKQILLPDGSIDNRYFIVSCEQVNYTPISLGEIKDIRGWK